MKLLRLIVVMCVFLCTAPLWAEEGMFLFSNPPKKTVAEKYGFEITEPWLQRVQKASIRFPGGSGSFVSSQGLVMTNHHVASGQLQALSTQEKNLLADGFAAKTHEEELPCKSLELYVLQSTEDVTEKVNAAVNPQMSFEETDQARKTIIAQIEKEAGDSTGLHCDVVTLYQGGQYHLYRYKIYNDVRLVFAPEQQAGAFGGDPDNFEYPRYCLDCTFFRAYEDGKPAQTPNFFGWSRENVKENELVFVSGHPGRTNRAYDPLHLVFQRDFLLPQTLQRLYRLETLYSVYAERSGENFRRIKNDLDMVKNSRKVRKGQHDGLLTPELMNQKVEESQNFWQKVRNDNRFAQETDSLPNLKRTLDIWAQNYTGYSLMERGEAFSSRTFSIARTIVRLVHESEKPNEKRLPEFSDANLERVKHSLFSDAPIYEDVEILKLSDALTLFCELNGAQPTPLLTEILQEKSPSRRATELIKNSKVRDVEQRKRLVEGGVKAVEESDDPMIKLALVIDGLSRQNRKFYETHVDEPLKQAYSKIADWKFQILGDTVYPDATFTLRLSYGTVKGYTEDDGTEIPAWTQISGLYERAAQHNEKPPYNITESWVKAKENLDMATPFNLVSTNDIIGGNSGSPLFNTNAEVVGLIFDGNVQSLSSDFIYTDEQARAVSVHSAVIVEALRKVYDMNQLADELGN